jgi:cytidylate kinase
MHNAEQLRVNRNFELSPSARDRDRQASPLVAAEDAITIDSTNLSIDQVLRQVLDLAVEKGL